MLEFMKLTRNNIKRIFKSRRIAFALGSFFFGGEFPHLVRRVREDMQRQVDTALAELDIVEEMLRPLVCAKNNP